MKWIGQHIWDFVSRFRGKVYLEDVTEDNSVTDVLVVDPNTKELKKNTNFSGGTGTSTITVKATEASGGESFSNINTIQVYDATGNGTGVQAYDNGTGKVLISVPPAEFSTPFSITRTTSFSNSKKIAISANAYHKKFWAGDWNGASAHSTKYITSSTQITYDTTSQKGNMENSSKIEVRIYGPTDNTNTGAGNEIGTATHTITGPTSSETFNADGIKIKVLEWDDDVVPNKNKARIQVIFSPSHIPDVLQSVNSDFSGSQKYYSVHIEHTNNDGSTTYGDPFNDVEFFYDGSTITPGSPSNFQTSISTGATSTMYLSNIRYYDDVSWDVSGEDIADLARDTRGHFDITTRIVPNNISTVMGSYSSQYGKKYITISNHDGTTNDDDNSFSTSYDLNSNRYYLSLGVGATCDIEGGMASDNTGNTSGNDSARAYNSYSDSSQTNTGDNFRSESHRLPRHNESTWNSVSISPTTFQNYAGAADLESDGRNLLIQTQHSGTTFKLVHPSNISTPAASPSQDRWDDHATPGSSDWVYYYRYFKLPSNGGDLTFRMDGVNRTEYTQAWDSGLIQVHFSRPTNFDDQVNSDWIPLNPNAGYTNSRPHNTCNMAMQAIDINVFNIRFDTNPKYYAVRIKMKGGFSSGSRIITGLSLTNGHAQTP